MTACELVCIPREHVAAVWPKVSHLIERAMRRGDIGSFGPVEDVLLQGHALLWVAWDGADIRAATVTQISLINGKKHATILACGGSGREDWLHLICGLEDYARNEACSAIRLLGRRGWEHVLPAYRVHRVLLERKL